jgi:hypothetical protein
VNSLDAGRYIELAKGKDIPIIFIGDDLLNATVSTYETLKGKYEKCVVVKPNSSEIPEIQGKLIADYVKENFTKLDRNEDGKISYVSYSAGLFAENSASIANELLTKGEEYEIEIGGGCNKEKTRTELVFYDANNKFNVVPALTAVVAQTAIMEKYNDEGKNTVELIITDNDVTALQVLVVLQSKDFNTDKLTTHNIPVFTVGFEADYKAYVLSGMPEKEDEKDEYLEDMKYLCDLTVVEDEDIDVMIWNTKNVIASGRLAGTVIEDQDAMAGAIAAIIRNFVKGNDTFEGLDEENVSGKEYLVPCIAN